MTWESALVLGAAFAIASVGAAVLWGLVLELLGPWSLRRGAGVLIVALVSVALGRSTTEEGSGGVLVGVYLAIGAGWLCWKSGRASVRLYVALRDSTCSQVARQALWSWLTGQRDQWRVIFERPPPRESPPASTSGRTEGPTIIPASVRRVGPRPRTRARRGEA